jgi:radical SAM protein with 4Fe4S-binding SPASM domain
MPNLLVQEVDFTGGEPFLRDDLFQILRRLKDLNIKTNIVTHGYGYSKEDISKLMDAGISGVGISLDGLQQTHDYMRRVKGSFDSVIKTIDILREKSLHFNVITTVSNRNLKELPELHTLLRDKGVQQWRLQGIIPIGRVNQLPELQLTDQDFHSLSNFIKQYNNRNTQNGLEIICSDGLQYIIPSKFPWEGCGAGIVTCGITADGRIKGCLSMDDSLTEGDLRDRSFWDIWFDDESFAYNRSFTIDDLGDNCTSCDKWSQCKGGCSSSSYATTGTLHNDPFCYYRIDKLKEHASISQ